MPYFFAFGSKIYSNMENLEKNGRNSQRFLENGRGIWREKEDFILALVYKKQSFHNLFYLVFLST